jgi:predicted SAM-dependent methyltransferase
MIKLNLACGYRYNSEWINLDFNAHSKEVKKINLLGKLPFDDDSVDIIYCSHFIEHLSPKQADSLLNECHRILKKDGLIRIVVPDLENIVSEYLKNLKVIYNNEIGENELNKYFYSQLELLDQMVREKSGGELLAFYKKKSNDPDIRAYVKSRTGEELESYSEIINGRHIKNVFDLNKIKYWGLMKYISLISYLIPSQLRSFIINKNILIGEKHKWMYDRISMGQLMIRNYFNSIEFYEFNKSGIPEFNKYLLDINEDGTPYKGFSSLYCEARK